MRLENREERVEYTLPEKDDAQIVYIHFLFLMEKFWISI